jgi:ComF family protein
LCEEPLPVQEREGLLEWLCGGCVEHLTRIVPPFCRVCGEPFDGALEREFRCMNCSGRRLAFDFAISAYRASEGVRELVHHFKYSKDLSLRAPLTQLLLSALNDPRLAAESLEDWRLVPVPLHRAREVDREFNQSRELCLGLSALTGIPVLDALRRVRVTDNQARLNREERLRNMRGAFSIRPRRADALKGARVLLVDDVLTTGATTHECAKVLKRDAGVEKIVVITVARG